MKRRVERGGRTQDRTGRPLMMYLLPGLLVAMVTVLILAVLADLKLRYEGADIAARIAAAGT